MDTQAIWEKLSSISIGTIVAWVIVIIAIITAFCAGMAKLHKIIAKYEKAKDKNEKQQLLIDGHERALKQIDSVLRVIQKNQEEQKRSNLRRLRYTIVEICEDAIERNEISINKFRVLEEMYEEYVGVYNGNGYVKTLVMKVRGLKIVGNFDNE